MRNCPDCDEHPNDCVCPEEELTDDEQRDLELANRADWIYETGR